MKRLVRGLLLAALIATVPASAPALSAPAAPAATKHRNFGVAIYVTVYDTQKLADPAIFARDFARVSSQVGFDKVYIEGYRDHVFATDAQIAAVKAAFEAKGVETAGGVTLAKGGSGGQFGSFDYADPADRAECDAAVRLTARHFDTIILDDFFFFNRKSDADIAAKGKRSWTDYRMAAMREAAQHLVIDPARAVNPRAKVIIKYPNWYEHFHGNGFDLEGEPQIFDGIYTGTETRDPEITDQLLQQYESYEVMRYFDHIAPGRNGGGWVDTFSTRYVDRYAEQLWDTMLAKAKEITLFNWSAMADARAVQPGDRPWQDASTSFDWKAFQASGATPGWGRAAGYALDKIDQVVGQLGKPIGIASYRPYHADGEDFLHNYLGNIGIPIELYPTYPADADIVLLTEAAKSDPDIIAKAEASLHAGHSVILTSGFVRAMQGKGLEDLLEIEHTGRVAPISHTFNGFGAGNGTSLDGDAPPHPVLFPQVDFYTNDSWPIIRGVAGNKGFPIMLMNRYSNGVIYELTIPENPGDLYALPQPLLTQIRAYVQQEFPVRIDAPAQVALFAYDNDTFVVESFRAEAVPVTIRLTGANLRLQAIEGNEVAARDVAPVPQRPAALGLGPRRGPPPPPATEFAVTVQPHSYQAYRIIR
jgi:hypothetical protein